VVAKDNLQPNAGTLQCFLLSGGLGISDFDGLVTLYIVCHTDIRAPAVRVQTRLYHPTGPSV
jgi:hypothetical protein